VRQTPSRGDVVARREPGPSQSALLHVRGRPAGGFFRPRPPVGDRRGASCPAWLRFPDETGGPAWPPDGRGGSGGLGEFGGSRGAEDFGRAQCPLIRTRCSVAPRDDARRRRRVDRQARHRRGTPPERVGAGSAYCALGRHVCGTSGLRDVWSAGRLVCGTSGLRDVWSAGRLVCGTSGLRDVWSAGRLVCGTSGLRRRPRVGPRAPGPGSTRRRTRGRHPREGRSPAG
jgi:hypothetical protein